MWWVGMGWMGERGRWGEVRERRGRGGGAVGFGGGKGKRLES